MTAANLAPPRITPALTSLEHPLDILRFVRAQSERGIPCALVMITGTDGGAVRSAGALMAVTETGARCGYLSGGCIDADIALNAQQAIAQGTALSLRYGRGSPFTDIKLPCGGGIDLVINPAPDIGIINQVIEALAKRQPATFAIDGYSARYRPKLQLRIAGIGADPIALLQIAAASGIDAVLWSQDEDCRANAANVASSPAIALTTPRSLPPACDDAYTAFILMAHDPDWETPLLRQALSGNAFYIGAVGSPNTHRVRCERLRAEGVAEADIARIYGPVGLIPSMRDASTLGVSCLAEIIACFHQRGAA